MSIEQSIEQLLREALPVAYLSLDNESDQHSGPPGRESHFRLVLVSEAFEGLMLVKRHQRVYAVLADLLAGPVHALALHTFTPQEWAARGEQAAASPDCRGGSAADA